MVDICVFCVFYWERFFLFMFLWKSDPKTIISFSTLHITSIRIYNLTYPVKCCLNLGLFIMSDPWSEKVNDVYKLLKTSEMTVLELFDFLSKILSHPPVEHNGWSITYNVSQSLNVGFMVGHFYFIRRIVQFQGVWLKILVLENGHYLCIGFLDSQKLNAKRFDPKRHAWKCRLL